MTQHGIIETEAGQQFIENLLSHFDVEQHIVGLGQVLDRERQLAAAPVFQAMDLAAIGLDHRAVALDHGRHLLTLVRVDQKHDFIMTHGFSLWMSANSLRGQPPDAR